MNPKIKGMLLLIINLAVNGTLWTFVPQEYKVYAMLVANIIQVVYAFLDPTYTIQQLGIKKEEFVGRIKKS